MNFELTKEIKEVTGGDCGCNNNGCGCENKKCDCCDGQDSNCKCDCHK